MITNGLLYLILFMSEYCQKRRRLIQSSRGACVVLDNNILNTILFAINWIHQDLSTMFNVEIETLLKSCFIFHVGLWTLAGIIIKVLAQWSCIYSDLIIVPFIIGIHLRWITLFQSITIPASILLMPSGSFDFITFLWWSDKESQGLCQGFGVSRFVPHWWFGNRRFCGLSFRFHDIFDLADRIPLLILNCCFYCFSMLHWTYLSYDALSIKDCMLIHWLAI